LTDAVEKVGSKSRMRNNRIEEACCSNQSCANYWFLESKIALRHAQNLFSTVSTHNGHRPACSDEAVSVAECIAAKLFAQEGR
jgi:hypothetical protein